MFHFQKDRVNSSNQFVGQDVLIEPRLFSAEQTGLTTAQPYINSQKKMNFLKEIEE
jgi:hypothetical protein